MTSSWSPPLDRNSSPDSENISLENISPSSDSGLGSEDEQVSPIYENITFHHPLDKSLLEITKQLSIDCLPSVGETTVANKIKSQEVTAQFDLNNNESSSDDLSEELGDNLSLLLTSQNPDRIDVRSLRRNKVRNNFLNSLRQS